VGKNIILGWAWKLWVGGADIRVSGEGKSLQKIMYKVTVLIWRLLITATNIRIIRDFNNRHNYPLKYVTLNCHNSPSIF